MMRILFLALILLSSRSFAKTIEPLEPPSTPWDTALSISPKAKYTQASIFGQGSVPAYKGYSYGADVEYIVGTNAFALGPYFELMSTKLQNTANSSSQKEVLDGTFMTAGLKLQSHYTFLKMGYSQLRLKDRASGTVNNSKSLESNGLELGAGLMYRFNQIIALTAGLDLAYYKISPSNNNISSRLDYASYALVLGLRFNIPSGNSRD